MQTIAKRIAAVKTSAARTGETGTFITFDTPPAKKSSNEKQMKKDLSIFFFRL
jgi:hypothetical protein